MPPPNSITPPPPLIECPPPTPLDRGLQVKHCGDRSITTRLDPIKYRFNQCRTLRSWMRKVICLLAADATTTWAGLRIWCRYWARWGRGVGLSCVLLQLTSWATSSENALWTAPCSDLMNEVASYSFNEKSEQLRSRGAKKPFPPLECEWRSKKSCLMSLPFHSHEWKLA